jgi:hypothetical protein
MTTNITPKGKDFIISHTKDNRSFEVPFYRHEFKDWQEMEKRARDHKIEIEKVTIKY